MYMGVQSSFSYACVLPSSKGCVFAFSVIKLQMNWRKWREMDGNFDNEVRRKWTGFMIFSGNWWWELSSIGPSLIPFTLSGFLERTTDTKQNRSGECAPYSCSSLSGGSSSPHHARCFHRCPVMGWRGLSVHGGLSSIFLFITDGRLQGTKVESPVLFSSFYSQLDKSVLIRLHACPGGLRLPSILFLSHILPRGS